MAVRRTTDSRYDERYGLRSDGRYDRERGPAPERRRNGPEIGRAHV